MKSTSYDEQPQSLVEGKLCGENLAAIETFASMQIVKRVDCDNCKRKHIGMQHCCFQKFFFSSRYRRLDWFFQLANSLLGNVQHATKYGAAGRIRKEVSLPFSL